MTSIASFNVNALVSTGGQTFSLGSLIALAPGQAPPAEIAIRAQDWMAYSHNRVTGAGYFSSPDGGPVSAGTAYIANETLYFTYQNGQYVSTTTGDSLSSYEFTTSTQSDRSVYLSLYVATAVDATTNLGDPETNSSWTHLSDLDIVTQTGAAAQVPSPAAATPQTVAAVALSFVGKVWSDMGCYVLCTNIATLAGASLPISAGNSEGAASATGNAQWSIVYDGARQTGDWRAMLQPGDMVNMEWIDGSGHIATVVSGTGYHAQWVDNSGVSANDGIGADIVIQGPHSVVDETQYAQENTVVIYRLTGSASTAATSVPVLNPPVLAAAPQVCAPGAILALSSLFTASAPSGAAITRYQFDDPNGQNAIHLNGAVNLATAAQQAAGVVIIGTADLGKLTYVAANTSGIDSLIVTAYAGTAYATQNVTVTRDADPAPVVAVPGSSNTVQFAIPLDSSVSIGQFFSATDPAGHPITQYRFINGTNCGTLVLQNGDLLNGSSLNLATNSEQAQNICRITASNLSQLRYQVTLGNNSFQVSAFDGLQWSPYETVPITGTGRLDPIPEGQTVALSSMFSASSLTGNAITEYTIQNLTKGGTVSLNGAANLATAAQTAQGIIAVAGSDLVKLQYTADSVKNTDSLVISAYDGQNWGTTTIKVDSVAVPQVTPIPVTLKVGQSITLAQLFAVTDADGSALAGANFQDSSGNIQLNGANNLDSGAGNYGFVAADLAKATYVAQHAGTYQLSILVDDGTLSSNWVTETITVTSGGGSSSAPLTVAQTLADWTGNQHSAPGFGFVSDSAAAVVASLDGLQALSAAGALSSITLTDSGTPTLTVTASQLSTDAGALAAITSGYALTVIVGSGATSVTGPAGHATTVQFAGTESQYTLAAANVYVTVGNGAVVDNLSNIAALQFADHTVIVAAAPGSSTVTTGNVTELYSAALGREPDVGGLAFYQNFLKANPGTSLQTFAEFFLNSTEYSAAHTYAQTTAGETQFITDSYQNLLHRAPTASDITFYLTNVLEKPGTQLQNHAQLLVYFSASSEFLSDVQITAVNPASAQHWLLLT